MKKFLLCLLLPIVTGLAHDHIEIGSNGASPAGLAFHGNLNQLATFFPPGEAPSGYLASFPGGTFASELTFSSEGEVLPAPSPALVRLEILEVNGPDGSHFSFWETGASSSTWTRASGWQSSPTDSLSFAVSQDGTGFGHIHGRVFTMDHAGIYHITVRAIDAAGGYEPSPSFVIQFTAVAAPKLTIGLSEGSVLLDFTSRDGLIYDLQSSTTLADDSWGTIDTLDGDGGELEMSDPVDNRPSIFYRLVEYQ